MKKVLLKAACALLAFTGISMNANAALNIEANKAYAVKHVASGLYLDIVNPGDERGTPCPVIHSTPSPIYFTVNPDDETKFLIHTDPEADTMDYLYAHTSNNWQACVGDTQFYWTLNEVESDAAEQVVNIVGKDTSKALGPVGYADGDCCYPNKPDSGNELDQWILMEYKEPRHITITIPAIGGGTETIENDIMDGDNIRPLMEAYNPLFFFEGFKESNSIVGKNNTSFTVNGKWLVNHAMRIKLRPEDENKTFIKYDGSQLICNDLTDATALQPERLWYFKYINTDEEGHIHVTIHTFALPEMFGVTANGDDVSMSANPTEFFITHNDSYQQLSTPHSFTLEKVGQVTFLSNTANVSEVVMYHSSMSPRDYNSLVQIFDMDEADFTASSWTLDGETIDFDSDLLQAAKESDGAVADMRALFGNKIDLTAAKNVYEQYTGVSVDLGGNISVPGYAPASTQVLADLYEAIRSEENIAEKMIAASEANPEMQYETTDGAIYAFKNVQTDERGYLCHNNGNMTNSAAANLAVDTAHPDFQFTFVTINGKKYIYNLAAEKFMNAFGEKTDNGDSHIQNCADFTWQFSDVPTEIKNLIAFQSAYPHAFSIQAGVILVDNATDFDGIHEGGLSMTNNGTRPNVVSMGITNRIDGDGLYAECIGKLTDEQLNAIVEEVTATLTTVPLVPGEFSEIDGVVNHFDADTHAELSAYTNGGGLDHVMHLVENGSRQGFEAGKVYNFFVDATNALKVDPETETLVVDEFDPKNTSFNLEVVEAAAAANVYMDAPEAKTYNFLHTVQDKNGAGEAKSMSYNGTTDHVIDMSELGKVKINGETLVAKVGSGSATTGIAEITAADGAVKVYDLQGRKLAAPSKGINIINGKKTIVK